MAYPIAATPYGGAGTNQNPAYSGVFIPEIWSGKLIERFYATTVLAAISNTDYEGEIKNQGDKIKIRTRPTLTIKDYSVNQTLEIERPSSNIIELTIDKGKYFNTALDDVMEVQSDVNLMALWSDDAAEQMKIKIDTEVLAAMYAGIISTNKGATAGKVSGNINLGTVAAPVALTKDTVLDYIIRMGQVLDEQNVPESGRWLVIPPGMASLLKMSDLKNAYITGDGVSPLRNGRIGAVDRFTIYVSNLLPLATGKWTVYAGTSAGLTFASQISKVETLRSEMTFSNLLRGLQVYGYGILQGEALVGGVVTA
jgi:hypothetical protein